MDNHTDTDNTPNTAYRAISLFSGMGGDTLGMLRSGIKVVAYSEIDPVIRQTHEANFPDCNLLGADVNSDITKITDAELASYRGIDFLFAGFPCQSFSTGGQRKMNDPRNTMFREFVRTAKLTEAKVVIGENVKGLLTKKTTEGRLYIDVIVEEFQKLDYSVIYKVFPCHTYGVPQRRERLVILGIQNSILSQSDPPFRLEFPLPDTPDPSQYKDLRGIVEFTMSGTLPVTSETYPFDSLPPESIVSDLTNTELPDPKPHPYLVMKRDTPDKSYGEKTYTTLFSFAKRGSPIHCEISDLQKPTKTIICTYDHQPRLFVAVRNKNGDYLRPFTPQELAQIQTFPKDYTLCGNTKKQIVQVGNAVPPLLIQKITTHLIPSQS